MSHGGKHINPSLSSKRAAARKPKKAFMVTKKTMINIPLAIPPEKKKVMAEKKK